MFEEIARKNEATILQSLAMTRQNVVAEQLHLSESTVSRMKDGELAFMAKTLAAMGLKVVPITATLYDPEEINALLVLARRRLESTEHVEKLVAFCRRIWEA